MSRDLTVAMAAAIAAADTRPILLLEAVFTSGTVRHWTGLGDLSWNGYTWTGLGDLIGHTPVDETDELKAQGITITVKGISAGDVSTALQELRNGAAGSIRLALLDSSGAIIADPKIIFRGRLDLGEIDDSNPDQPVITLGYEHELIDLERPREWRYTDQHQQQLYPGDTGLSRIADLQDRELVWGRR